MIHTNRIRLGILALGIVLGSSLSSQAQQATQKDVQQLRSYNVSRESFLLGTVVKFTTASDTPPMGAHVILQTSSGQIDVHLGDARVLKAAGLELNPADSFPILRELLTLADSTYFSP